MKLYACINTETGMFIEDVLFESKPLLEDGTPDPQYKTPPMSGDYMYWPRWDFDANGWTEGGTAPEPVVPVPTAEEQLRADLDYLAMMTGVVL